MAYYKSLKKIQTSMDVFLVYGAVFLTLVFSPFNFDGLLLPKMIFLFILTAYSIPILLNKLKNLEVSRKQHILFFLIPFLVLADLVLIVIVSDAPIEQQVFGRTGRGLGFITYFSLIILTLNTVVFIKLSSKRLLLKGIVFASLASSAYAYLQRFNLDFFNWDSRTNGIIGTLGNPNFQSSLSAMAVVPAFAFFLSHKYRNISIPIVIAFLLGTVYICQSTQGYIGVLIAILVFVLIKIWFVSRRYFYASLLLSSIVGIYVSAGMLNYGYFSKYLYKISIQSRGDFWRSALATAKDNPIFGVGLDSFKDYFFLYRDQVAANHSFAEVADNAHNYYLQFAATGGFPLSLMYLVFTSYALYSFIKVIISRGSFDSNLAAIFSAWCVLQAQSIISPNNIVLLIWSFILSGTAIGLHVLRDHENSAPKMKKINTSKSIMSVSCMVVALLISYPLFRTDRVLFGGLESKNGDLIIKSTTLYPRSENIFNLVGVELLKSNLLPQSLEVAKRSTQWNPNAVSGWGLIVVNPTATNEERELARLQVLRLDPLNKEARELKF
jgi:O-antigen ligase